ncbi:MAG: hypothetical protein ACNA8W_01285, partial [Bradymonadaceae bacterium]
MNEIEERMMSGTNVWMRCLVAVLALAFLASCSDDVVEGPSCPSGESYNVITGQCQSLVCPSGQPFNPVSGACDGSYGEDDAGHVDLDSTPGPDEDAHLGPDTIAPGPDTIAPGPDTTGPIPDASGPDANCPLGDCDAGVFFPDTGPQDPFQPQQPGEVEYHSCTEADTANLTAPQFIINDRGNYLLAVDPAFGASSVSIASRELYTHFFEDDTRDLTGFVTSLTPAAGQGTPAAISDHVLNTVKAVPAYAAATQRSAGLPYQTHDRFSASIRNFVELPSGTKLDEARDLIYARLAQTTVAELQHTLATSFDGDADKTLFAYKIVRRSDQQYVLVGAFVTATNYDDFALETGSFIDDLVGGTALAMAEETMTDECISYTIRDTNEVDIIISLDASGSMNVVQAALANFAEEFTELLDEAEVDWRIGITGVDCEDIRDDTALSEEYRALWPEGSGSGGIFGGLDIPCKTPFGVGGSGNNGRLIGGNFTTDFAQISQRMT